MKSWTSEYRKTALSARNFKERLWRGADINDNIGRRDIVVQYVKDRHEEITDYKQVRYKPTSRYISEAEWIETKDAFPQCCEPCTKTKSDYKPDNMAVIHRQPGDHKSGMREELISPIIT